MIQCETLKVVPIGFQQLLYAAKYNENMSRCKRRHIGCAIGTQAGILSSASFNGDHGRNEKLIRESCAHDAVGKCGCMHAEIRAICCIQRHHNDNIYPDTVAITAAPCLPCAQAILDMWRCDIKNVLFWEESEPGEAGVAELINYGLNVWRVAPPA